MAFWHRKQAATPPGSPQTAAILPELGDAIREVASAVHAACPPDFTKAEYLLTAQTPTMVRGKFTVITPLGVLDKLRPPNGMALAKQRMAMVERGEQPWTHALVTVDSTGSYNADFSYDDEPPGGVAPIDMAPPVDNEHQIGARAAAWSVIGEVAKDIWSRSTDEPASGPEWPGLRQSILGVRLPSGEAIAATDGLSDAFADHSQTGPGFGLEFYVRVPPRSACGPGSPAFSALLQIAQNAAYFGDFHDRFAKHEFLSIEVDGAGMDERWITREGRVGVLMGVSVNGIADTIATPAGDVRLVSLHLLTPAETLQCGTDDGRRAVAQRVADAGGPIFDPTRTFE